MGPKGHGSNSASTLMQLAVFTYTFSHVLSPTSVTHSNPKATIPS